MGALNGLFKSAKQTGLAAKLAMPNKNRAAYRAMGGAIGAVQMAARNPWKTTAVAFVGASIVGYGSQSNQTVPAGKVNQQAIRPNSISDNKYDLGASGDLVFALHKLS